MIRRQPNGTYISTDNTMYRPLVDTRKMTLNGALQLRGLPPVNKCRCGRIISANNYGGECARCAGGDV